MTCSICKLTGQLRRRYAPLVILTFWVAYTEFRPGKLHSFDAVRGSEEAKKFKLFNVNILIPLK